MCPVRQAGIPRSHCVGRLLELLGTAGGASAGGFGGRVAPLPPGPLFYTFDPAIVHMPKRPDFAIDSGWTWPDRSHRRDELEMVGSKLKQSVRPLGGHRSAQVSPSRRLVVGPASPHGEGHEGIPFRQPRRAPRQTAWSEAAVVIALRSADGICPKEWCGMDPSKASQPPTQLCVDLGSTNERPRRCGPLGRVENEGLRLGSAETPMAAHQVFE